MLYFLCSGMSRKHTLCRAVRNILSEFYIIIFLNKLKIVENTKKEEQIKMKRLWLRLWGPSEIHGLLLGSPGPGPMYRLNPTLIGPVYQYEELEL
jgi:hypothetical protein